MVRIVKARTLLAGTGPAVVDASQAFSVEVGGALCARTRSTGALMSDDEHGKHRDAQQEPDRGKGDWKASQASTTMSAATESLAVPKRPRILSRCAVWSSRTRNRLVYSVDGDTGAENTGS